MGSPSLRDLGFVGKSKCADFLEYAGFSTVADVRNVTLLEASRKLQEAIESFDSGNKTRLAFKAFRCVFTIITAQAVDSDVPICFRCPISHDWMKDPVVTPSGNSFERQNIESWIDSFSTDPFQQIP